MQRWTVEELTHPELNHGWWTTPQAYAETLRNQSEYLAEIEYLQGIVNNLKQRPEL